MTDLGSRDLILALMDSQHLQQQQQVRQEMRQTRKKPPMLSPSTVNSPIRCEVYSSASLGNAQLDLRMNVWLVSTDLSMRLQKAMSTSFLS